MKPQVTSDTIIRTFLLGLAIINNALTMFGKSPLPIEDEIVTSIIGLGFTLVTSVLAWWKNNSFTPEAIEADLYMEELKDEHNHEIYTENLDGGYSDGERR